MPGIFVPILKSEQEKRKITDEIETFEDNDEESTGEMVGKIFIGISLMTLAMIMTWLFIWSYNKDRALFMVIFASLTFIYALKVFIYIMVTRSKMSSEIFRVYLGSAITMLVISTTMIIFFAVKFGRHQRSSSSYVPPSVQEYINPT
jgi:heme/copper-type cytochrome/quinol oxidase subunit 2